MPYLGSEPPVGFASTTKQAFNGDASAVAFTLSRAASVATDLEVFVDNVQQEPTTAYSVSGTTLTFTAAPATGTGNIYVVHRQGGSSSTTIENIATDLSFKSDGTVLKFGADSDITLTHVADTGLNIKNINTGDNKPVILTLQTGETDLAANEVIGKIAFQSPDEGTGTDAILVSAAIQAIAEGDHSSSSNATSLQFMTGVSEAASSKMVLSSAGNLDVTGDITGSTLNADGDTAAGDNAAMGYTSAEGLILTGQGSTNDVTIKNDADADVIEIPTGTVNVTMAGSLKIIDTELAEASDNFSINIQSGNNDFQVKSGGTIFAAFKGSAKDLQLTSGNLVIGTAGKGIDFSAQQATQLANASAAVEILSHYEQGTFTPVFINSGGVGIAAYAVQVGTYTRIGAMVHAQGRVVANGLGDFTSGSVLLQGLPYDQVAATNGFTTVSIAKTEGLNITAGFSVTGSLPPNSTQMRLELNDATTGHTFFQVGELSADGGFAFSFQYHAV